MLTISNNDSKKEISSHGITGFTLKVIAAITMLLDHIAWTLIDPVLISKGIVSYYFFFRLSDFSMAPALCVLSTLFHLLGRLAFPIFLFLLVEGFCHTRNIKKYIIRMAAFALISETPFDLCMYGKITIATQNGILPILRLDNVFFTLTLALIAILVLDTLAKSSLSVLSRRMIGIPAVVLLTFIAYAISSDYALVGVPAACAMYLLRNNRTKAYGVGTAVLCFSSISEIVSFLMLPFIRRYNGQRGKYSFAIKYAFYIIYPLHLIILWRIRNRFM